MNPMSYEELAPDLALRRWVASYWRFTIEPWAGPVEHWVPPDGGVGLMFHRAANRILFVGPFQVPLRPEVHPGDDYLGVRFWPGAGGSLPGVSPQACRDRVLGGPEVLGAEACQRLCRDLAATSDLVQAGKVWHEFLVPWVAQGSPLDEPVMAAVLQLVVSQGLVPVAELAQRSGVSARHFRRRFRAAVGLSAKELARLRRARACLSEAVMEESRAWADLAAEYGFSDQSHLIREVQDLLGLTPAAFEERFRRIDHSLLPLETD